MSELALATRQFESSIPTPGGQVVFAHEAHEVGSMREKLETLRDVMISLGLQLMFRATILLRRWNY